MSVDDYRFIGIIFSLCAAACWLRVMMMTGR